MAITNNLVVWGSAATDWVSASFPSGAGANVAGFKPGSLIYAQEANRAFRNATLMQWGLAQVLASYAGSGSPSFAIGFSDVAPTADALNAFANNLSLAITAYVRNNVKPLEADKADAFKASKWVTLTGAVTGSVSSTGGWEIATTIADSAVGFAQLAQSAVTAAKIAQSAVTSDKVKDGDIGAAKLATSAVTSDKIKDGDVTAAKLATSAVTADKINDGAVANSKLQNSTITFMNGGGVNVSPALGASCQLYQMFGFNAASGTGLVKFVHGTSAFYIEPEVPGDHASVIPNHFMASMPYVSGNFPYASMVGASAFYACSQLTSISLPAVKYIGSNAFVRCTGLTSISLPNLESLPTITNTNEGIFKSCGNLSIVNVPKLSTFCLGADFGSSVNQCLVIAGPASVTGSLFNSYITIFSAGSMAYVPSSFFANCQKLKYFSSATTAIPTTLLQQLPYVSGCGSNAFSNCVSITNLYMQNCSSLGENAFSSCTNLSSITLSTAFTVVPDCCFAYCHSLKGVPNDSRITEIGATAFANCYSISSMALNACTKIGPYAFHSCSNLTIINGVANLREIGSHAFEGCSLYTVSTTGKLYLDNVATLGSSAFYHAGNFKTVIMNACQRVPQYCFANNPELSTVSITGCSYIESSAFANCPKLSVLYVTSSMVCGLANLTAFSSTLLRSGTGTIHCGTTTMANLYRTSTNWSVLATSGVNFVA